MRHILLTALASLLLLIGHLSAAPATQPSTAKLKIVLVGDSTVEDHAGWGPGFKKLLSPDVICVNWAKGGRSSKSFINEGWWKKALDEKPDYVLIQFGHNDQPGKGPERETDPATTFPQWMARYVDEARAIGAKPILVTSMTRRAFDKNGKIRDTLGPYVEAVKKLATDKNVPVIDLHARSIEVVEKLGPEATEDLNFKKPVKPGETQVHDGTHLSPKGSDIMGKVVADEVQKVVPELQKAFRD